MAFVFSYIPGQTAGTLISGNGEFIVRVPFAFDDETGDVYSIVGDFAVFPGGGELEFEFGFKVIRASPEFEQIDEIFWDGQATMPFLSDRGHRAMVLGELFEILRFLIVKIRPQRLVMMTHTANLPKRALVKFQKLVAVMREEGLDARKTDSWNGRHIWIAIR
ncbi:MAG TPA: hypothetical protein PLQ11_08095 [Beijerinckiaceae bacterium]|nr:hypothetical protein [Beijerinckiaceae bacterium]